MTTDEVMTVPEAAKYLRVSSRTVYRLFDTGDLARSKVGGRVLVRRVDVLRLVLEKRVAVGQAQVLRAASEALNRAEASKLEDELVRRGVNAVSELRKKDFRPSSEWIKKLPEKSLSRVKAAASKHIKEPK